MLNQVVIVGRLVSITPLSEDNEKSCVITVKCPRSFKNADGIYENDMIDCILVGNIATNTMEHCNIDDILGVKGRIQEKIVELPFGTRERRMEIVCEKLTFLSNTSNN